MKKNAGNSEDLSESLLINSIGVFEIEGVGDWYNWFCWALFG
jgi:hypothetical protein